MKSKLFTFVNELNPVPEWRSALAEMHPDDGNRVEIARADRRDWRKLKWLSGAASGLRLTDGLIGWGVLAALAAGNLPFVVGMVGVFAAGRVAWHFAEDHMERTAHRLADRRVQVMTARLIRRRLGKHHHDDMSSTEFEQLNSAEMSKIRQAFLQVGKLILDGSSFMGAMVAAAVVAPIAWQSLAIVTALMSATAVTFYGAKQSVILSREAQEADQRKISSIRNVFTEPYLWLVKRYGLEGDAKQGLTYLTNESLTRNGKMTLTEARTRMRTNAIFNILLVPIVYALCLLSSPGIELALRLTGTTGLAVFALTPLHRLPMNLNAFATGVDAFKRVVMRSKLPERGTVPPDKGNEHEVAIELRGVNIWINGIHLLKDIDLKVHKGERVALAGENGIGKSVLLRVLAGIPIDADVRIEGEILINGQSIKEIDPDSLRSEIGVLHQFPTFLPEKPATGQRSTVRDNLLWAAGIRLAGESDRFEHDSMLMEKLREVDLHDPQILDRPALGGLSGGQAQRVAAVAAYLSAPRIVFLDEPQSAQTEEAKEMLLAYHEEKQRGCTVIAAEHQHSVLKGYKRVFVLGKFTQSSPALILQEGRPEDLQKRPGWFSTQGQSAGRIAATTWRDFQREQTWFKDAVQKSRVGQYIPDEWAVGYWIHVLGIVALGDRQTGNGYSFEQISDGIQHSWAGDLVVVPTLERLRTVLEASEKAEIVERSDGRYRLTERGKNLASIQLGEDEVLRGEVFRRGLDLPSRAGNSYVSVFGS